MSYHIKVEYPRTPMTPEEFSFFWKHPPLCNCGTVMTLEQNSKTYACYQCGRKTKLLAAGSNIAALNMHELHKISIVPGCT
jgi:hypothetical protein